MDLEALLLLLAELLLVVVPQLRKHLLRRKRVCSIWVRVSRGYLLMPFTEKEESDEDMGFGLFD